MDRYKYNLLELCQNIHMTATGASDPAFDYEEAQRIYEWLKWRIEGWNHSIKRYADYDQCVKALCQVSLKELTEWLEQYDKELSEAIDNEKV
jgi:hypothetical protein